MADNDLVGVLRRPIDAAHRLLSNLQSSTDPEYLKRKAKRMLGVTGSPRSAPKPYPPPGSSKP